MPTVAQKVSKSMDEIGFSINTYDSDGDLVTECIIIHYGQLMLKFDNVKQLIDFSAGVQKCVAEIISDWLPNRSEVA